MDARTQAIVYRFVLGLLLVEIPVLVSYLTAVPTPDERTLLAGLLGGVAGALSKYLEPQIVSIGNSGADGRPTIVGVALRNVNPAPPQIDRVEQQPPTADTLDAVGATKIES